MTTLHDFASRYIGRAMTLQEEHVARVMNRRYETRKTLTQMGLEPKAVDLAVRAIENGQISLSVLQRVQLAFRPDRPMYVAILEEP
jgi:hypothetical protein